ncbi:MAG: MBL fold metallo-hydrolase [Sporomusaceae bacterium]|nr:MBL fold metallo-hydrolase [Sporomusaceae bacterium]
MQNDVFKIGQCEITTIVTGGKWKENCYLVKHIPTGEMVLLDPGDDADVISHIINSQNGILTMILLTHAHHDHIGAVKQLGQSFDVMSYLSKGDARLLKQAPLYAAAFTGRSILIPDKINLYDNLLSIPFGNSLISVIPTPGHTPGSVCCSFGDFLFTGDTLLYEHVGRTDLPGGNVQEIIQSVSRLLTMSSGEAALYPGHGRPWSMTEAKTWWQQIQVCPPEYNTFER